MVAVGVQGGMNAAELYGQAGAGGVFLQCDEGLREPVVSQWVLVYKLRGNAE